MPLQRERRRKKGKIARMNAKKQSNRLDAVRNAATGYAVVVLGILCFLLVLVVLMAGTRIVLELGRSSTANAPVKASAPAQTVPRQVHYGWQEPLVVPRGRAV